MFLQPLRSNNSPGFVMSCKKWCYTTTNYFTKWLNGKYMELSIKTTLVFATHIDVSMSVPVLMVEAQQQGVRSTTEYPHTESHTVVIITVTVATIVTIIVIAAAVVAVKKHNAR